MREITLICPRAQDFIGGPALPTCPWERRFFIKVTHYFLVIAGLALAACGRNEPPASPERPILPILAVRDAPQDYTLADPACQLDTSEYRLSSASVAAWSGDEIRQRTVGLTDTFTKKSLVNPAISRTTFGAVEQRLCSGSLGPSQPCLDKNFQEPRWEIVTAAKDLRVCGEAQQYGRQTYEGVALTSAFYIQEAWKQYRKVAPDQQRPSPVVVSILPHLTDYYVTQNLQNQPVHIKRYMTHNLAYFPEEETITVFPESKKRVETAQGFLWESGFVLAHEYGHHIDFERHGAAYRAGGLRYDPVLHVLLESSPSGRGDSFDIDDPPRRAGTSPTVIVDHHGTQTFHTPSGLASERGPNGLYESRRSLLGSALAEGFADLLAYYTDGANGQSVIGLPGIGISRDVGSRYFGDGLPKILTDEHLEVFFREKPDSEASPQASRFSDVHAVGAILAFAADQIFTRVLKAYPSPTPDSQEGVDRRYVLALEWMDKVTAILSSLGPNADRNDLIRSVSLAIETTVQRHLTTFPLEGDGSRPSSGEMKRDLCLTFEAILPGFASLPFANPQQSCPL